MTLLLRWVKLNLDEADVLEANLPGNGKARVCFCKQSACTVVKKANVCYVIIANVSEHESPSRPKGGRAIPTIAT